jgi:hypothetical protein
MKRILAWVGALTLAAGCGGGEAVAPDPNATLEVVGYTGPLEAQTSRLFTATWRDPRGGTRPAAGVTWSSNNQGVAEVNQQGLVTGVAPGQATLTANAEGKSLAIPLQVTPLTHYSPKELAVFNTLVFSDNGARRLRKWADEIRIQVSGAPTAEDLATLDNVVRDLSGGLRTVPISVVEQGGNVHLAFIPDSMYAKMAGGTCVPPAGVWGFSCPTVDAESRYTQAVVYVSSTRDVAIRNYLLHHELMHMVGFYDHPTGVASILTRPEQITLDHYLPLDYTLMEMLGRPEISVGTFAVDAMVALSGLTRLTPPPPAR